jgi:ubiquinol-cytochrome c reductase core subunit 2
LKLTNKTEPKLLLQKEAIKVTKLQNGIVVATLENHSPLSRIAVVVNASARHESYNLQGAAHALRTLASLVRSQFE